MSGQRFLVVEDDVNLRARIAAALVRRGHEAREAGSHAEAVAAVSWEPTHAILDLRLGEEDGLAVLAVLREELPGIQAVILTGYGSIATAIDAVHLGAVSFLQKPATIEMILTAFERGHEPLATTHDYQPPSLARAEWEHIQRVLSDCGGNISEAARRLGLHRRTLQRKLQKYPPRD